MKSDVLPILLIIMLLFGACRHREFDYETDERVYVEVVFDWENEPESRPESMALFMFPRTGARPARFDFSGHEGGLIKILPGIYDAVCLNSDERDAVIRGNSSFHTFEVSTSEQRTIDFSDNWSVRAADLPRAQGREGQPLSSAPPLLWSATEFSVSVLSASESSGPANTRLVMKPSRIVSKFIVTVKNIKNIKYVKKMSATISDMADGYLASKCIPNDASVTIPLDLPHKPEANSAEGEFMTFGHCSLTQRIHKLMIYAVMNDGSGYYFERDVTDKAHSEPDADNVYHILVEGLDLPKPGQGGNPGGLSPDVNSWNNVDIGLTM